MVTDSSRSEKLVSSSSRRRVVEEAEEEAAVAGQVVQVKKTGSELPPLTHL